jgi:predicted oxidoreductase
LRHIVVSFCVFVCVYVCPEFDILLHAPKSFQPICYVRTELKSRILEALLCLHHQRRWLMNTEQVSESFSVLNGSGDGVKHLSITEFLDSVHCPTF